MLEQRGHRRVLAAIERPLVLPDHDRIPAPLRIRELSNQSSGLRAPSPLQLAGLPRVEKCRTARTPVTQAHINRERTETMPSPIPADTQGYRTIRSPA
jgi:hypothetical protein